MRLLILLGVCLTAFGDWMDEQITSDLAAFPPKSISKEALRETMKNPRIANWHAELALAEIRGGKMEILEMIYTGWDYVKGRMETFVKEVNQWQSQEPEDKRLPDTLMLLSFGDGLDISCCKGLIYPDELKVPLFVFSKRVGSSKLVLIPDHGAMTARRGVVRGVKSGSAAFPWKNKEELLFWRGSATDGEYRLMSWKKRPRAKLTLLSVAKPQLIDAGLTSLPQVMGDDVMDDILKQTGGLKKIRSIHDHMRYKYLMDIDGNSNGWDRCFWGLLSNSALFKQVTDFSQWYYKALKPWVHFVPVKKDLSDLEEKIAWAKSHDGKVCAIAEEGRKVAQEIFRREAVFEYMRRLLTAYNERLVSN